jgi:hypothetical protein
MTRAFAAAICFAAALSNAASLRSPAGETPAPQEDQAALLRRDSDEQGQPDHEYDRDAAFAGRKRAAQRGGIVRRRFRSDGGFDARTVGSRDDR